MKSETIKLEEMGDFAKRFCEDLNELKSQASTADSTMQNHSKSATIVALHGNLGAGKTTFTQAIARELGIQDHITSPTFVILKKYSIPTTAQTTFKTLIHIDAYRLEKGSELAVLGWDELVNEPTNLICLEWPGNVSEALPSGIIKINFETKDENTREICVEFPAQS